MNIPKFLKPPLNGGNQEETLQLQPEHYTLLDQKINRALRVLHGLNTEVWHTQSLREALYQTNLQDLEVLERLIKRAQKIRG